jgi:hypothetical protein
MEPITVQQYRYTHAQKTEQEHQCIEKLEHSIIHPSCSTFSVPVVLVKKSDSSWHFCVDYRTLNGRTVKDKFPIPMVEELLDELQGAALFTKLHLRSGYHQELMHPDNINKMTFHTHQGLFEFLMMPSGLMNMSATFQALMNKVPHPFMHCFVLVLFDDILIYNTSWAEHLHHVRSVLTKLQGHHLFLKRSKCAFSKHVVVYLGPKKVPGSVGLASAFLGLVGYYRHFI